jgi:hypothetical protein
MESIPSDRWYLWAVKYAAVSFENSELCKHYTAAARTLMVGCLYGWRVEEDNCEWKKMIQEIDRQRCAKWRSRIRESQSVFLRREFSL